MISEQVLNPRFVYTQPTEPTDKTKGKMWYNTLNNSLYVSDGESYRIMETDLSNLTRQQLEQNINILINSASASSLNDYDDMYLDIFSQGQGFDNTIEDTISNFFSGSSYRNSGASANINGDANISTSSLSSDNLIRTYTPNQPISQVYGVVSRTGSSGYMYLKAVATFEDDTTETKQGQNFDGGITLNFTEQTKIVKDLKLYFWRESTAVGTATLNSHYYHVLATAPINTIVYTVAQAIESNPIAHQVYCHNSVAGSGNVTYDISFDDGVTWETDQELNIKNTSVHSGSTMKLRFNLNGEGSGNTSEIDDYAVMLYH